MANPAYPPYEQPFASAASVRGPFKNEILVVSVGTAAKVYNLPDGLGGANQPNYLAKYINVFADGANLFVQLSNGLDATADDAAVSTEVLASGRYTLTPTGNEVWPIMNGQWQSIPLGTAKTLAIKASAACKARMYLSET